MYTAVNYTTVQLLGYGNALRTHQELPANTNKAIDPVLSQLSPDVTVKLDEVTSIIITCEAMDEFPQFLVMKAVNLPNDKRKTLIDFVSCSYLSHDNHVTTLLLARWKDRHGV